ncbi:MAG: geranylgeranyl reductase family protein [Flavobacteriales bacterium]|jgi:geranylgeranyl reductase family protein|nr:MAG: geranylgeranyl reductase family protein [Flavobacteriales bacterium]
MSEQPTTGSHSAEAVRTGILIIGGGPGGASAALRLSALGVPALLLDKAVFPRDKVCGDALSGKVMRSLERLDMGLAEQVKRDALAMPSWGVVFVAPSGRSLRVPFSRTTGLGEAPGAILPRLRFDDLLFRRAKGSAGVSIAEGEAATGFERTPTGWRVITSRGRLVEAELIIDAAGANSAFARHVAKLPMDPRHHAAGVRAYCSGVTGLDPQGFIELIFLKDLLPGYLWVFPLPGGRANVGLGLRSDVAARRKADLKAMLRKLLTEHPQLRHRFVAAQIEGAIQGMGLPLASKRLALSGDGYLLVGDAGHLIDPFTGEGISHAMISGVHAAEVAAKAIRSGDASAGRLKEHDERVWRRLGKELAISTRLQQLADKPWLFDFVVDRANRNPALADTISSMFTDLDLRERLKRPGFYMDLVLGRRLPR